ncbi:MAG: histidinol dehydrogenase [Candidatus Bathyarchaeota archaeon B26-2]|nr:MAG: histidinol dehydrogenase [Candidatus Bathyarchaeota archaeon B26-2]
MMLERRNEREMKLKIRRTSAPPKDLLEERQVRIGGSLPSNLEVQVRRIIETVKERGDSALIEFTEKFDGVSLEADRLKVTEEDVARAYDLVSEEQISAIELAKSRVELFEKNLLERLNFEVKYEGVEVYSRTRPLRSVGCYVPGGEASYPSTVVMTVTPAKVAGVPRVVVCTPPKKRGEVEPITLVASDICGADEVYMIGGAQAIAALAYGTGSIRPVEKVVGPGNRFVLAAKLLVSRDIATDLPAGPSEVLILADESADPRLVALDMVSQAEHGVWGYSILVTVSSRLADEVQRELEKVVRSSPRAGTVEEALSRNGLILVLRNLDECISFVNEFAPEHLEVMVDEPLEVAERINAAGLVLIGRYTPASASDYCLGVNHVLPTGGFGRVYSGLSVLDFVKRLNIVKCSREGLSKVRDAIRALAEAEGLPNHALSVEERFKG